MAWSTSNRKSQLPSNWDSVIRPAILRRDKHRCVWLRQDTQTKCGEKARDVDHKDQTRNWDHSPENLQSLCPYHHGIKSSSEGGRAKAAATATRKAAARRRHPGLID